MRFEGEIYELDLDLALALPPDYRARIARESTFLGADGTPLAGLAEKRARNALAGTYASRPVPTVLGGGRRNEARPMLIPGLWPTGIMAMLSGQPKVGKTTLLVDSLAALLIPGRRFLDYFEPANLGADPRHDSLYIWLISAEMPPDDLEDALRSAGVPPGHPWLTIDHLRALGGAQSFDLTNPEIYDHWEDRLVECYDPWEMNECWSPSVVVVDGLTAILAAAGKGVEHYGLWIAAFRRLMDSLDIPNALVVAHSTYAGDHPMGGVEGAAGSDGVWTYSASAAGKRTFLVKERLGSPPVNPLTVEMTAEGRLVARPRGRQSATRPGSGTSHESGTTPAIATKPGTSMPGLILARVNESNAEGFGPSLNDLRKNVSGSNLEVDANVARLLTNGQLFKRPRVGRGGGDAYWIAEQDDPAAGGNDSK